MVNIITSILRVKCIGNTMVVCTITKHPKEVIQKRITVIQFIFLHFAQNKTDYRVL